MIEILTAIPDSIYFAAFAAVLLLAGWALNAAGAQLVDEYEFDDDDRGAR